MSALPPAVVVKLRKPLERSIAEGHPWIYRDGLEPFTAVPGAVATVTDSQGRFVARGIVDDGSIAVRVYSTRDEVLGPAMLAERVRFAAALRAKILPEGTDAYRLVHGEGDRLPGVVCDVYGPWAVMALDGGFLDAWAETLSEALRPALEARGVSALLWRRGRGDEKRVEALWGEAPPERVTVRERGVAMVVDLARGQKTGLFLDQRESRHRVRDLSRGMRVLNLYGYTGGFSVAAGVGGAERVTTVDVAPGAVALAGVSWEANGLPPSLHEGVALDVPKYLAERARGGRWELVIADPPSFAPNEASLPAALKSYRALHTAALGCVAPGGYYLAGSCSSHVTRERFVDTIREAAGKLRRAVQVVDVWGAGADHPRPLGFPEGEYLKNVLLRAG